MNDSKRLPLRLYQKHEFNDTKRSINILRKMINDRGYTYKLKMDTKKYEVYIKEDKDVTYLIYIGLSGRDSVSKESFIASLVSYIDHTLYKPRIIYISHNKGSDHVNRLIDTINHLHSNKEYHTAILLVDLADVTNSKGNYGYIREWILSKEPVIEWFLINDIPANFLSLLPKHELDNGYTGDTQYISHTELVCRYNLWTIGDIIKIHREDEVPVHRKVI